MEKGMNPEKVAQTLTLQKAEASKPRKEYTGVAGRVLKFLCGGCTPIQAANACGVSESLERIFRNKLKRSFQRISKLRFRLMIITMKLKNFFLKD